MHDKNDEQIISTLLWSSCVQTSERGSEISHMYDSYIAVWHS